MDLWLAVMIIPYFSDHAVIEGRGRVRKAAAAAASERSPPRLTHLVRGAEEMRQCCNSAALRDASGATGALLG